MLGSRGPRKTTVCPSRVEEKYSTCQSSDQPAQSRGCFRSSDPGALGYGLRPLEWTDDDERPIGLSSDRKTHPAVVQRVPGTEQIVTRMFQNRRPLMRSDIERVDLIRAPAENQDRLFIARPVRRPEISFTNPLCRTAGRRRDIYGAGVFFKGRKGDFVTATSPMG